MIKEWLLKQRIKQEMGKSRAKPLIVKKRGFLHYPKSFLGLFGRGFKQFFRLLYKPLSVINKLPFALVFSIFLCCMFTAVLVAHKYITSPAWVGAVLNACPEITTGQYDEEGNIIQISPLDKIMADFTGHSISRSFAQASLLMFCFVSITLQNARPRKPQVLKV